MLVLALIAGCGGTPDVTPPPPPPLDHLAFNARAVELALPVFQKADGTIVQYESGLPFDGDLDAAAKRVREYVPADAPDARIAAVRDELRAGRITLIETDLSGSPDVELVRHLVAASKGIEALFALQTGAAAHEAAADPESRMLVWRNQGPWCVSPKARPECGAVASLPARRVGLYPAAMQEGAFCEAIAADFPAAMLPFQLLVDGPTVVPYTVAWGEPMAAVAAELRAAAAAAPADEAALAAYLRAAADAFGTNDWFAADAAWAAMGREPSRWYLRVGPDETYFDPCGEHAGFAMTLARRDTSGAATQALLEPVKQDLEAALAALVPDVYQPRTVGFELPEFIEIVLNAGDSRAPLGATIGQSLPNWGPVADAGGRTVAMTNMNTDPDSVAATREALASLFCADTLALWPSEPEPLRFSTVLHEAGHNLGPAHEYAVGGKTDEEIFGGSRAAMLEELKAQNTAMYLTDWLGGHGVIPAADVTPIHVADLGWALFKVSKGMRAPDGSDQHYSQLAAVQLGWFLEHGGVAWKDQPPANGADVGCVEADPAGLVGAIASLEAEVLRIKATGDVAGATALVDRYVDGDGLPPALRTATAERFGRVPEATYVYRVVLGP